jgi:hypothetical protein
MRSLSSIIALAFFMNGSQATRLAQDLDIAKKAASNPSDMAHKDCTAAKGAK